MGLPTHAEIVIVGGGIAGCSSAYHLAKLGKTDEAIADYAKAVELDPNYQPAAKQLAALKANPQANVPIRNPIKIRIK